MPLSSVGRCWTILSRHFPSLHWPSLDRFKTAAMHFSPHQNRRKSTWVPTSFPFLPFRSRSVHLSERPRCCPWVDHRERTVQHAAWCALWRAWEDFGRNSKALHRLSDVQKCSSTFQNAQSRFLDLFDLRNSHSLVAASRQPVHFESRPRRESISKKITHRKKKEQKHWAVNLFKKTTII